MTARATSPIAALVQRLVPGIRYPWLVVILGGLLAVDLAVPDPIPLLDEVVLAILTVLAASWRTRRPDDDRPPKDVTPPDEPERALPGADVPARDEPDRERR